MRKILRNILEERGVVLSVLVTRRLDVKMLEQKSASQESVQSESSGTQN